MSYPYSRSSHSTRNGLGPSVTHSSYPNGTSQGYYGNSLAPPPSDRRSSSSSAAPTYNYSVTPPPASDRRSYSSSQSDAPAVRAHGDVGLIECPVSFLAQVRDNISPDKGTGFQDITSRISQADSRPMSGAGGPFSELFVGYLRTGGSHIKVSTLSLKSVPTQSDVHRHVRFYSGSYQGYQRFIWQPRHREPRVFKETPTCRSIRLPLYIARSYGVSVRLAYSARGTSVVLLDVPRLQGPLQHVPSQHSPLVWPRQPARFQKQSTGICHALLRAGDSSAIH